LQIGALPPVAAFCQQGHHFADALGVPVDLLTLHQGHQRQGRNTAATLLTQGCDARRQNFKTKGTVDLENILASLCRISSSSCDPTVTRAYVCRCQTLSLSSLPSLGGGEKPLNLAFLTGNSQRLSKNMDWTMQVARVEF